MGAVVTDKQAQLVEELAIAIARNQCGLRLPLKEVLAQEGVSLDEFNALATGTDLTQRVKDLVHEMMYAGKSFKLKARIQAEQLLTTQWQVVHDPDTPAMAKVKAIENVVRWAELEPKKDADTDGGRPQIAINIDLGGGATEKVVVSTDEDDKT